MSCEVPEKCISKVKKPSCIEYYSAEDIDDYITPSKGCTSWFDGCNSCSVKDGKIERCTYKTFCA